MGDWDLLFFKNKLIPSSSDEDNPHLLSDDSEEEKLFKRPFADILRDVGKDFYDQEKRKIKKLNEENRRSARNESEVSTSRHRSGRSSSQRSSHRYSSGSRTSNRSDRTSVDHKQSEHGADSMRKSKQKSSYIEGKKEKERPSTQQLKDISPPPLSPEKTEPTEKFRIEENTFLAVKEQYRTTKTIVSRNVEGLITRRQVEILHIVTIKLSGECQKQLKCESGVDILLEQPWGIVSKTKVLANANDPDSPFRPYIAQIQAFPEEEMIIGRSDEINSTEFVFALTLHGRELLLEELKDKHVAFVEAIMKTNNFPVRPWISLGSDLEIDESHIVNQRPFISYDCAIKIESHTKLCKKPFDHSEFYTEINDAKPYRQIEMVRGIIMDKASQASPATRDIAIQTVPEIPVNATTQFSIEMRVEENEEILANMELEPEFLSRKLNELLLKVEPHLLYNENFDVYIDDYENLTKAGEEVNIPPVIPYKFVSCMFTFLGTEKKGVSSLSWHPNIPGVIAVSYAVNSIAMVGELQGNSDDEYYPESDSDDENLYADIVTRTPFDNVMDKVWTAQIEDFEHKMKQERDKSLYRLATTSLQFMKYARDMRLFQMVQAKKQFLNLTDAEDMDREDMFEYPLFEGISKKYNVKKEIDVDKVLERKSTFLNRDYLFSDTFKWKLKGAETLSPIYMMIKDHKKMPKKYIRTFLFREIWSGDEWHFGSDLELQAIDINRDFREAGIFALGMPLIPKQKVFLPGFRNDESVDHTKEIPWRALECSYNYEMYESESSSESEKDSNCGFFDIVKVCDVNTVTLNFRRRQENLEKRKSLTDPYLPVENAEPNIVHVTDAYLSNIPWGFNAETQDFLLNEIKDIATSEKKELFKNDIEIISEGSDFDHWEKDDDIDELDKLNLQHYVVIWTIGDILRPLHRLSCPFEITAVSFCPHDGNIIAGGLSTGQVVLWEVYDWYAKDIHNIKITDPDDEEGFQHLRKVMSWFKRLSKIEHIPVTSLSCKDKSHNDRVIDITWLPPDYEISISDGPIYKQSDPESVEKTMQFMSTSADGTILFWDLKCDPRPPLKATFSAFSLNRGNHFPVPNYFKKKPLKYENLYLRWDPLLQINLAIPECSVAAVRYHITCISPYEIEQKYTQDPIEENTFHFSSESGQELKPEAIIGTVSGTIALITWQPTGEEPFVIKANPDPAMTGKVLRIYNLVHDGPIVKIARHPKNRDIFLTAGGHVFALWTIERVDPLKWKKYTDDMVTFVGWTTFQASTFRVGFSNGSFEVWDLLEDGNKPKMSLPVGQGCICEFTVPRLPTPEGLVGIIDQKGLLKFYIVPKEYRTRDSKKDDDFFEKIEIERNRKKIVGDLAAQVRKELQETKDKKKKVKKLDEDEDETEDGIAEEEDIVKVKEIVGCKKYKEEMYKWYLRRRGRAATWLDPAEKKWYTQEEEHMIKTILQNKKVSMEELEVALVPLKEKEKHEAELAIKKAEIANMADKIFQKAVQELQATREEVFNAKPELKIEKMDPETSEAVMAKVEQYFGQSYLEEENKLEEWVKLQQIDENLSFGDILTRNQKVRDFWNDRRRYLNKDQRWLRELVKEELEKQGLKFSYWIDHEESYKIKKYKRRLNMIDKLKKIYGPDYDPFWDLDRKDDDTPKAKQVTGKSLQIRELIKKLLNILQDLDPSVKELRKQLRRASESDLRNIDIEVLRKMVKYYINFVKEGGIRLSSKKHKNFMNEISNALSNQDEVLVEINIPQGSFYKKYIQDKQVQWAKPARTEDIFSTPTFKFKYGDSYPDPSDEEFAEPKVLCADLEKKVKAPTPSQLEREQEGYEEPEPELEEDKAQIAEGSGKTETTEAQHDDKEKDTQPENVKEEEESTKEVGKDSPSEGREGAVSEEEVSKEKDVSVPQEEQSETTGPKMSVHEADEADKDEIQEGESKTELQEAESTIDSDEKAEVPALAKVEEDDDDEGQNMSEATKRLLDITTLYEIVEERKAKGEEIINIEDLSSYESIESQDSISSLADSPDQSICSDDWAPQRADYLLETEEDLKEYFEGPPPRYEPPRRRPYFRAPHEDEPTEEWISEEKGAEEFGKTFLGVKPDKNEKQDKPE